RYIRGSHLSANILHGLPVFKCGFHGQKIRMLAIVSVPLDRSACSREPATARQPNCIFCENLRQGVCELLANCRKVVTGHAYLPLGIPVTQMPGMLPTLPPRERCSSISTRNLAGAVSAQPARVRDRKRPCWP